MSYENHKKRDKKPLNEKTTDIVANCIRRLIEEKYANDIIFAYLFGSSAKNETTALSDIDIAVYFSDTENRYLEKKLCFYGDLCRELKRNDIDLVVLNTTRNIILLHEIVSTGILLHDRDSDLRQEFECKTHHTAIDFKTQRFAVMGV